jgi:hypothetical protein
MQQPNYRSEIVAVSIGVIGALMASILLLTLRSTLTLPVGVLLVTIVALTLLCILVVLYSRLPLATHLTTIDTRFGVVSQLSLGLLLGAMSVTALNRQMYAASFALLVAVIGLFLCSVVLQHERTRLQLLRVLILLTSMIMFSSVIIGDEYLHAYDAPFHTFLASGYLKSWWSTQEPQWYGGYNRLAYPPLAHQLVALGAYLTGSLQRSYCIVAWSFLVAGCVGVYCFSKHFVGERASILATLIYLLLPSLRTMLFIFGQFAGFTSLVLLLFCASAAGHYLRYGTRSVALLAALLAAASAAAHHNTTIFLLPVMHAVILLSEYRVGTCPVKTLVIRAVTLLAMSLLAVFTTILPFWIWLQDFQIQMPIPHPSRENIFTSVDIAQLYFFDLYGSLLILLPLGVVSGLRQRMLAPLSVACLVLFVIGLGGTTPLPALLYGHNWEWLTFERFAIWATCLSLPILGHLITRVTPQPLFYLAVISSTLLVGSTSNWLAQPAQQRITPPSIDIGPILNYFHEQPVCAERYLALGFHYQFPDLSTYSDARTLDGMWHTARTDALLRSSGVGALSDALYWNNGRAVLESFLSRRDPLPAYCIFINEVSPLSTEYKRIIRNHGWRLTTQLPNQVSIWTNQGIHPFPTIAHTTLPGSRSVYGLLWGVMPLFSLISAMLIGAMLGVRRLTQ